MKKGLNVRRSYTRAAGQVQTSVAMDAQILHTIGQIAKQERRSRNKQIFFFLERQIAEYERVHGKLLQPLVAENTSKYGNNS